MKVIMLKDVGGVGQRGTVKEISDGYALNYLIPNGLAEQATDAKVKALQAQQAHDAERASVQDKKWGEIAKQLQEKEITVAAKANDHGHLYRQLSSEQIERALRDEHQITLPAKSILLSASVREIGLFDVFAIVGSHKIPFRVKVVAGK